MPALAISLIEDQAPDTEWDTFVDKVPGGDHVQTTMWSRVKRNAHLSSARVVARRGGVLVGGCQLLLRGVGPLGTLALAPRAPLAAGHDDEVTQAVLDGVDELARRKRVLFLKLQPPKDRLDLGPRLCARGFVASGIEAGPTATARIDVNRSPEELLAAMRSSSRRNLRKAERSGVSVRVGGEGDLVHLGALLAATEARQGFRGYDLPYYAEMWRAFRTRARLLLAEHEGRVLAGLLLIGYGDTVVYKMGGWSGEQSSIRPNELCHWHGIRWAQSEHYGYYDLEGIEPSAARALIAGEDLPTPLDGLTTFKLALGGQPVLFPGAYDRSYRTLLAPPLRWAAPRTGRWLPLARRALGRGR